MKARTDEGNSQEVYTVEEYSIYGLDKSLEGLEHLKEDALSCCESIESEKRATVLQQLIGITSNLNSFRMFEDDISSLFTNKGKNISDEEGTLADTESDYHHALDALGTAVELGDLHRVAVILKESLVPCLDRFRVFIPSLKQHITREFVNA